MSCRRSRGPGSDDLGKCLCNEPTAGDALDAELECYRDVTFYMKVLLRPSNIHPLGGDQKSMELRWDQAPLGGYQVTNSVQALGWDPP